jgi:hypothetical protein
MNYQKHIFIKWVTISLNTPLLFVCVLLNIILIYSSYHSYVELQDPNGHRPFHLSMLIVSLSGLLFWLLFWWQFLSQ